MPCARRGLSASAATTICTRVTRRGRGHAGGELAHKDGVADLSAGRHTVCADVRAPGMVGGDDILDPEQNDGRDIVGGGAEGSEGLDEEDAGTA